MNPSHIKEDELFQVELRIAQRADQLARLYGKDPVRQLEYWRQAEREVWHASAEPTEPGVFLPRFAASGG